MTKIEQVARALAVADGFHPDTVSNDEYEVPAWRLYVEMARAAIQAMREPTQQMRDAVEKAEDEDGYVAAAYEHMDWSDAWPIAIDAALSETSEES